MAALLSVRAIKLLRKVPDFHELKVYFWSDSTCVLAWIRNKSSRPRLFVQRRIEEIVAIEGEWRYIRSAENPADLASRGADAALLMNSELWMHGPSWLTTPESWPPQPPGLCSESNLTDVVLSATSSPSVASSDDFIPSLLARCSSLSRFERIVAWILRFVQSCRHGVQHQDKILRHHELQTALQFAIQCVQENYFPSEITDVRSGKPVARSSSLFPLRPSWDESRGILVTTPRTQEPPKIFLPPESRLTLLIVMHVHKLLVHAATDRTLAKFQATYWTCRARTLIKRVLKDCLVCKRHNPPCYEHHEGHLPDFRSTFSHPFEVVGLDHAGPLYLHNGEKVYVLLFTCACTRAIHLEMVHSLGTDETGLAFRRFQARRGIPLHAFSDNAPCFKKLSLLLRVDWKFIPERSPTWGGWWERMVQTVKRSLRKVIGRSSLNSSELHTILVEIEGAVNDRPLTYVSDEPNSVVPLTPATFLNIKQPLGVPWIDSTSESLGKRWKYRQKVAADLIKRWYSEYLPTLRQWRNSGSSGVRPQVGDVAILREGAIKNNFTLVRVIALHPGRDGVVRVVTVRLRGRHTRRLVRSLYPLECSP